MYRSVVLGAIVVFGCISITISAYQAQKQTPAPSALNNTRIEKVKDNLYVITGSGLGVLQWR